MKYPSMLLLIQVIRSIIGIVAVTILGMSFANLTLAQTEHFTQCEITESFFASVSTAPAEVVTDTLKLTASIANGDYLMSGVTLIIPFYREGERMPSFWTIAKQNLTILPNTTSNIPLTIDMRALPSGTYSYHAFVGQGDALSILGQSMLVPRESMQILEKTGSAVAELQSSYQLNGVDITDTEILQKISSEEPLKLVITTKNISNMPMFESSVLALVTEGDIPVGTAIGADIYDNLKLLPGSSRVTTLSSNFLGKGKHTLFITTTTPGKTSPIEVVDVMVGEGGDVGRLQAYLTAVGVSKFPLNNDAHVLACFGVVGATSIQTTDSIRARLTLRDNEQVVFESEQITEPGALSISFVPENVDTNVTSITLEQLASRQKSPIRSREEAEQKRDEGYVAIDTVKLNVSCDLLDGCITTQTEVVSATSTESERKNLLIFLPMVLLLILLVLWWIRTTHKTEHHHQTSKHELQ